MAAMETLLEGLPGIPEQKRWAREIATLPMRLRGLGLRSTRRTSPAAHWASWADALHMVSQRLPGMAKDVVAQLNEESDGCLVELQGQPFRVASRCQTQCLTVRNRVIGSTVGNIMRRPLPSAITGRPWRCPNRRMPIRPISGPNQAQGRVAILAQEVRFGCCSLLCFLVGATCSLWRVQFRQHGAHPCCDHAAHQGCVRNGVCPFCSSDLCSGHCCSAALRRVWFLDDLNTFSHCSTWRRLRCLAPRLSAVGEEVSCLIALLSPTTT